MPVECLIDVPSIEINSCGRSSHIAIDIFESLNKRGIKIRLCIERAAYFLIPVRTVEQVMRQGPSHDVGERFWGRNAS